MVGRLSCNGLQGNFSGSMTQFYPILGTINTNDSLSWNQTLHKEKVININSEPYLNEYIPYSVFGKLLLLFFQWMKIFSQWCPFYEFHDYVQPVIYTQQNKIAVAKLYSISACSSWLKKIKGPPARAGARGHHIINVESKLKDSQNQNINTAGTQWRKDLWPQKEMINPLTNVPFSNPLKLGLWEMLKIIVSTGCCVQLVTTWNKLEMVTGAKDPVSGFTIYTEITRDNEFWLQEGSHVL